MPAFEPVVLEERKYNLRHIGPRAQVFAASPAVDLSLLNRADMVARPLPTTNLPNSPDFVSGGFNLRLMDAGDFQATFPNKEASDGVAWRYRFDPGLRLQWLEVMVDDYLEGNYVLTKVDDQRDHVEIDGFDGWFCLKSAFERDWTVTQAPRDTLERATQVWVPLNADNFQSSQLSPQWSIIATSGGTVNVSPGGGCTLSVPASGITSNNITNRAGAGANVAASAGSLVWSNPGNITTNNTVAATANNPSGISSAISDILQATGYGFGVPGNATINGVIVNIVHKPSGTITDNVVSLVRNGNVTGNNKASAVTWTGAGFTTISYGSSSDTWGIGLTPADVNNSQFGVAFQANVGITSTASIDYISVQVFWSVPASSGQPTFPAGTGADAASFGGTSPWVNPGNVTQYDGVATFAVNFSGTSAHTSHFLQATNFGFGIPSTAAITGIEVYVVRNPNGTVTDQIMQLLRAGAATGNNKASGVAWSAPYTTVTYGGPGDLWGTTWTPADINNSNFGAQFSVNLGTSTTAYVDVIEIQVFWTIPATNGAPTDSPSSGVDIASVSGTSPWANPNLITANDGSYTTATNSSASAANTSDYLEATNFGFAIPGGATIVGVEVDVIRKSSGTVTDDIVKLLQAGTLAGSNKASGVVWVGTSPVTAVYGGAADTWGIGLSPADVNNANFGLGFQVNLGTMSVALVDTVTIKVYYTISASNPVAGIQSSTKTVQATGTWRSQSQVWVPNVNGVVSLNALDGVGLTLTESNGDSYSLSFFGSTAVTTLNFNGTVISTLTPGVDVFFSLELESDGNYVFGYINGALVGCILRGHPTTTTLNQKIQLEASSSGTSAMAIVTNAFTECMQPFLMAGTDKGDYVLPGNLATYTNGGLHARYSNNADLQGDANRLIQIHSPPRMVAYGNTSSNEYQNQQDATINAQQNPLPGAPTSDWSCVWFGAIWLKLSSGNYTFSITLPAHANNQAVRVWVGKTKLGDQLVDSWNFSNTSSQSFSFTVNAASLAGTLSYGAGTHVVDGWYPLRIDYAVDGTATTAPVFRLTNSPAAYTDPGGTNITAGGQSTVVPATSLSPLGCDDNRYQGVSHFDLAQKTAVAYGYQLSLEPYPFETLGQANQAGYFPGVLAPRLREGRDYDSVLEPDLRPRQASDALTDYGNLLDSSDNAVSMWGNGSGFQNGQVGQLQANVFDPTALFEALYDMQGWQDASDASFIDLLQQTLNSELGLRIAPWQSISAAPHGRPRLANIWPLQGSQAAMRWRPGDGLRVLAREINVDDANPRQLWLVARQILPNGTQSTNVGLAGQPNLDSNSWSFQQKKVRVRDPRVAMIKKIRQIAQWQRSYQRNRQTIMGVHQRDIPIHAGKTSSHESAVALLPTDSIIDATLRINTNSASQSFGVFVNGVDKTAALGGPWTRVPVNLPLLRVAQTESSANQLRVTLHNRGGSPGKFSFQLIVDVLR